MDTNLEYLFRVLLVLVTVGPIAIVVENATYKKLAQGDEARAYLLPVEWWGRPIEVLGRTPLLTRRLQTFCWRRCWWDWITSGSDLLLGSIFLLKFTTQKNKELRNWVLPFMKSSWKEQRTEELSITFDERFLKRNTIDTTKWSSSLCL